MITDQLFSVLSEHETLELLEQLKLGVMPGTTSGGSALEVENVGHWPVLIGGGMCLNLQSVAALELNRQPDSIYVTPALSHKISSADLARRYHQVHHLSTGVDGRTLIIAYDRQFSVMLRLLQESDYHSAREYSTTADLPNTKVEAARRLTEFSQAVATSIDPGPSINGQPVGLSFLELDNDSHALVGGWRLQLGYHDYKAEIFIGLINSHFFNSNSAPLKSTETFSIIVRPENICRGNKPDALVAELAEPELIKFEKIEDCGSLSISSRGSAAEVIDSSDSDNHALDDLLVQKMLQLSVDDLYLLLVEAIGRASTLRFSFDIESLAEVAPMRLLQEGSVYRCLTVNGLPLRHASLIVSNGRYLLKSCE